MPGVALRGPVEPPRWPESHSDGGGPLLSSATPALIIRLAPFCEPSQAFDFLAIQDLASLWVLNLRTCTYWPLGCLASTYHSPPTLTGSAIIDHGWGTRLSPLLPSFFGPRIRGIMSGRQSLRHRPTPPASENLQKETFRLTFASSLRIDLSAHPGYARLPRHREPAGSAPSHRRLRCADPIPAAKGCLPLTARYRRRRPGHAALSPMRRGH